MEGANSEASTDEGDPESAMQRPERSFTCTVCGYATTHRVGRLRVEVRATCPNCGDWTVQTADVGESIAAARDAAERLAGTTLTERQALAYLLREFVGLGRREAADAMETTPSNVDNLHRRGREKVADARRIVEELRVLGAGDDPGAERS